MASEAGTRWAALFPGQGSQAVGMGRSLADAFPEARTVFERADAALGDALSTLCFEGPEEELRLTRNTQPALLTVSVAAWEVLRARGVPAPAAAAGHSLGEYSALVAAGVLTFEDAVRAVRLRGEAMQDAVPVGEGAMAALIGLHADSVDALCAETRKDDEILVPANFNGLDQIVVAGHASAVERLVEGAAAAGAKRAVPLPVSAPFHCPLMQPAAERLAAHLADVHFEDAEFPVVANVDAEGSVSGEDARRKLIEQVASPVRWVEVMQALGVKHETGFGLEIGCGRVLAGLARRMQPAMRVAGLGEADHLEKVLERFEGGQD